MKWSISVPVWGDWHTKVYLNRVLPYHKRMGLRGRYIVHTNRKEDIAPHLADLGCEVEFRNLPGNPENYDTFGQCHLEAFRESEACLFLNADGAFSEGAFDVIQDKVENGARLIAVCGLRTLSEDDDNPPFDGAGMNEWAVQHLHPALKTCVWGHPGPSLKPTQMFFQDGADFWTRTFHLHPLAAVRDNRRFETNGTVDGTFVAAYWPTECWVAQNHEIAGIEFSRHDRAGGDLSWNNSHPQYIADSMRSGANWVHRHFFTHRIALRGQAKPMFDNDVREILARL